MQKITAIKLFESKQVRTIWSEEEEKWYFSIVDVIEVLTGSSNPRRYWSDLKNKLTKEGSQLYENIVQLKLEAADGKKYATDCLDTQSLLRLIQSVPSPKAEPFKMWLAKVGFRPRWCRHQRTYESLFSIITILNQAIIYNIQQ